MNAADYNLTDFCRRRSIQRLGIFGSVARGDDRPDSDLDVLVEFAPNHIPGFSFWDVEDELTALLGRQTELHTPEDLSPYFREQVLAEAQWLYRYDQSA